MVSKQLIFQNICLKSVKDSIIISTVNLKQQWIAYICEQSFFFFITVHDSELRWNKHFVNGKLLYGIWK